MKVYSRKQIYEADQATVAKEGIPSINLMERAGGYLYEWVHQRLQGGKVPCLLYTSPSPRDKRQSRMPSSA